MMYAVECLKGKTTAACTCPQCDPYRWQTINANSPADAERLLRLEYRVLDIECRLARLIAAAEEEDGKK
jgi:hypothetical protein